MRLVQQVQELTRTYVRKGGKDNRRQQAARMLAFAAHCEALGAREMGQVGAIHVIRYWKASTDLSDATRYSHWLAIRKLWFLAGKPAEPPRPFKAGEQLAGGARPEEGGGAQPTGGRGAAGPSVGGSVRPPLGGY